MTAEVAIVGAGLMGLACAQQLAPEASRVVVLERGARAVPPSSATRASAGTARLQRRTELMTGLAKYGVASWAALEGESGAAVGFRRTGLLVGVVDPERIPELELRIEQERSWGLDVRLLVGERVRDVAPAVGPEIVAGTFCPDDGYLDTATAAQALLRSGRRSGATVMTGAAVSAIEVVGGRVTGVTTGDRRIACDVVVITAGAWSPELLRPIGLELPIIPHCQQVASTWPLPMILGCAVFVPERLLGIKQLPSGVVQLAGGRPGHLDETGTRASPDRAEARRALAEAAELIPSLAGAPVGGAVAGVEGYTPDGLPFIGPVDGVEGLFVAAAFSGSGIVHALGVARLIRSLVLGTPPDLDVAPFAVGRWSS